MSRLTSVVEGWICVNPEDNDCPTMYYCECCDIPVQNCLYFFNAIAKLKDYEDLEEQGLLKRFECAIGDTVYRISKSRPIIYECTVQGIKQEFNTTSYFLHANINEDDYSIWVDNWFDRCQIGYEFYLTKEEAEKELKEKESAE